MTFSFSRYDLVCLFSWAIGRGAQMFSNAFQAKTAVEAALSNPSVSRGRSRKTFVPERSRAFRNINSELFDLEKFGKNFPKKM
jgi:hypothetical protein